MPASYACHPESSRGRLHAEAESTTRTCFQRDRDRIIHSTAFRRLQYKTQVFVSHEGDHYRTRLTHSLEVAQIARSIARALGLDEDLAEALALAHDLGHTPFGHAGEEALDAAMREFGGFSHNDQTLRVLTRLERRYAGFDGLNLTWETLEGTVKHNGPLDPARLSRDDRRVCRASTISRSRPGPAPRRRSRRSPTTSPTTITTSTTACAPGFSASPILPACRWSGPVFAEVGCAPSGPRGESPHPRGDPPPDRPHGQRLHRRDAARGSPRPRSCGRTTSARWDGPWSRFPTTMRANDRALRAFLMERMYRHYRVSRMAAKARRIVGELFQAVSRRPAVPADRVARADRRARGRRDARASSPTTSPA